MTGRVIDVGDACITLELDARVDPDVNGACLKVARDVAQSNLSGVRDIVTTYHTVAVYMDPLVADREAVAGVLMRAATGPGSAHRRRGAVHEIPVCYGDEFGPDLEDVARFARCSTEEVVRLHSGRTYRVYMLGFLPGFAYLGKVDERIGMGRHEAPRMRVQAGSVAIAGFQTGIYPVDSPGGWRVVGRTWVRPFDLRRPEPSLFRPGDMVRFLPVSRAAFLEGSRRASTAHNALR